MSGSGEGSGVDCGVEARNSLRIAVVLNATMFIVGMAAGIAAQSSALIADAIDMFADAAVYGMTLVAIGRNTDFRRQVAHFGGCLLLLFGFGAVFEAARRAYAGSEPVGSIIIVVAALSLVVNAIVLWMLSRHRHSGVHLRASWIFTRADVIANLGVIVAAVLVIATGSRVPDLTVGVAIGLYVVREALEIFREARNDRRPAPG